MKGIRPYIPRIGAEVVAVPLAEDMDDETLLLHLEKRHAAEVGVHSPTGQMSRHAVPAWIGAYRAFHDRLHKIATPGQYDHEHEED